MTISEARIDLIGESVTLSYLADPGVSYGQFRLENRQDTAATVVVERAWLALGEREQQLEAVSLFDRGREQNLDPQGFVVAGGAALQLLVGFPKVAYEPPPGETCAVGLRVRVDDLPREALSPIQFVRRVPLTRR